MSVTGSINQKCFQIKKNLFTKIKSSHFFQHVDPLIHHHHHRHSQLSNKSSFGESSTASTNNKHQSVLDERRRSITTQMMLDIRKHGKHSTYTINVSFFFKISESYQRVILLFLQSFMPLCIISAIYFCRPTNQLTQTSLFILSFYLEHSPSVANLKLYYFIQSLSLFVSLYTISVILLF